MQEISKEGQIIPEDVTERERPPLTAGDAAFINGPNDGTVPAAEFEEPAELTIDDLFKLQVSEEEIKQVEKDSILPVGTYTTIPEGKPAWTAKVEQKDGRISARLFGKVLLQVEGKEDVAGAIGYALSSQRRNKIETLKDEVTGVEIGKRDTGKPDHRSKLFAQAVKAYTVAYGEAPTDVNNEGTPFISPGKVITYLIEHPHRVRIIQTQDGSNIVMAISAVVDK